MHSSSQTFNNKDIQDIQENIEKAREEIFKNMSSPAHRKLAEKLTSKIEAKEFFRLNDLTKKEKVLLVSSNTLYNALFTFAIWTSLGYIANALIVSGSFVFGGVTIGEKALGQATFGAIIQGIIEVLRPSFELAFLHKHLLPHYVEDDHLLKTLKYKSKTKNLVQTLESLVSKNTLNEIKKKLGDSSYNFTMLGVEERGVKRKLIRIKDNFFNQFEHKAQYSYKDKKNKYIDEGMSKKEAKLKAGSLKVLHSLYSFVIHIGSPNTAEDLIAGLAGRATLTSAILPTATVTALGVAGLNFPTELNKVNLKKRTHYIGLEKADNLNSLPSTGLTALKNTFSFENLVNIFTKVTGRAVGRAVFEISIKEWFKIKDSGPIIQSIYEGLRAGFGQWGGIQIALDTKQFIELVLKNREDKHKLKDLFNNLTIEQSQSILSDLENSLSSLKNDIDEKIDTLKNLIHKFEDVYKNNTNNKILNNQYVLNWIACVGNEIIKLESIKEKLEIEKVKDEDKKLFKKKFLYLTNKIVEGNGQLNDVGVRISKIVALSSDFIQNKEVVDENVNDLSRTSYNENLITRPNAFSSQAILQMLEKNQNNHLPDYLVAKKKKSLKEKIFKKKDKEKRIIRF